eukprot:107671-Prymnesium_polylepis.1
MCIRDSTDAGPRRHVPAALEPRVRRRGAGGRLAVRRRWLRKLARRHGARRQARRGRRARAHRPRVRGWRTAAV